MSEDSCNVKLTVRLCKFFRPRGGDTVKATGNRKPQRSIRTPREPNCPKSHAAGYIRPQCSAAPVSASPVLTLHLSHRLKDTFSEKYIPAVL